MGKIHISYGYCTSTINMNNLLVYLQTFLVICVKVVESKKDFLTGHVKLGPMPTKIRVPIFNVHLPFYCPPLGKSVQQFLTVFNLYRLIQIGSH